MLRRKITSQLENWYKTSPQTALCIFGARQVGKTTVAQAFARQNFQKMVELNFLLEPGAARIFETAESCTQLLERISLFKDTSIVPGNTLLLLDEIQECPAARTPVKGLVLDGTVRVIETGSLLGVRISEIKSHPVGYEEYLNMYPLDFEEFLWAAGVQEETLNHLKQAFDARVPVDAYIHHRLLDLWRYYLVVGGMPAVCQEFFTTRDLPEVVHRQRQIVESYRSDIAKYADKTQRPRILEVFESIPPQLASQNLRFYLSEIRKGARIAEFEQGLDWIIKAGIALPSYNVTEPQIPLELNEKRSLFRLFFLDTGLLCSCYPGIQLPILQNEPDVNWGAVLENAAAQSLVSAGFQLFYFSSKKYGELDFVLQKGQSVVPVEMKSGSSFHPHPALNKVLQAANWTFAQPVVFCTGNVHEQDGILYLPWYMLMFLEPEPVPSFSFEALDLPL